MVGGGWLDGWLVVVGWMVVKVVVGWMVGGGWMDGGEGSGWMVGEGSDWMDGW